MDYAFLREREGDESLPILVVKDVCSGALAAHAVPYKGGNDEWVVEQVNRDMVKWGIRGDVILRTDQEDALRDLANQVHRVRQLDGSGRQTNVRTFEELSPVGESQSNGAIEAGVKNIEGMVRTLKYDLEEKLQIKVNIHSPLFHWLIEHAADLHTKYAIGREDGMTAWERLKGKKCSAEVHDFASRIMHRVPGKTKGGEMSYRWLEGVWLGNRWESSEHYVGLPSGDVVRAGAVQSVPEERQWDKDLVLGIHGKPWQPTSTIQRKRNPETTVPRPEREVEGTQPEPAPVVSRGMPVLA